MAQDRVEDKLALEKGCALLAKDIVKTFPGVIAVNNVTFDLRYGEIHGLLGQNGAGKSTLLKVIYGIHRPDRGKLYVDGKEVHFKSPREARKHGIVLVHQEITVMPDLTALENIALLGFMWDGITKRFSYGDLRRDVEELLSGFKIHIDLNAKVRDLSAAERMLIQVVAALTINAKILLLDEPTSPLSLHEVKQLFNVLDQLKKEGFAMAFVTHRINEALEICDRITVLRNGEKVGTVEKGSVDAHSLVKMMLGRELEEVYMVRDQQAFNLLQSKYASEEPLIELRNIHTVPQTGTEVPLRGVNIKVYEGENVAVFGFIGAGKTELGKTLLGLTKVVKGDIIYKGKRIKIKSPVDAIEYGIFYLPEDRRNEGLIPHFTVAANMDISSLNIVKKYGLLVDQRKETALALEMIKKLSIVTPSPNIRVVQLSGGNQQKVLVARAMLSNAKLVIFDEPTVGIDVGAKAEIRRLIFRYSRERGVASLVLTSDLDEALGLADRIYVMRDGKIVGEFVNKDLNRDEILKLLV